MTNDRVFSASIVFYPILPNISQILTKKEVAQASFLYLRLLSEGDAKAVDKSGKSCGCMQITPILVKECNRILDLRKSKKRYSMEDRFSVSKSKEMFLLFQSFYNPKNDVELAIRSWNGGMNFTRRGTQRYYQKVMSKMK